MDIGNVGYPRLVDPKKNHLFKSVRIYSVLRSAVPQVVKRGAIAGDATTKQIVSGPP